MPPTLLGRARIAGYNPSMPRVVDALFRVLGFGLRVLQGYCKGFIRKGAKRGAIAKP